MTPSCHEHIHKFKSAELKDAEAENIKKVWISLFFFFHVNKTGNEFRRYRLEEEERKLSVSRLTEIDEHSFYLSHDTESIIF